MDNDLEEGEVLDSENEEEAKQTGMTDNNLSWRAEASCAASVATAISFARKPMQRLRSDSSDSASSKASDTDSDEAPFAKKTCRESRRDVPSSHVPAPAARPASKYNIWGSVLQEQTLAKDLTSWFGMNTKVISDREVETYDYRKAKESTVTSVENPAHTSVEDESMMKDDTAEDAGTTNDYRELQANDDEDINICDRETFGTSASTKFSQSSEGNDAEHDRLSRKRKHSSTSNPNRQSVRNRVSRRTYDREKDRGHIRVSVNDTASDVGEELVRVLAEPQHMRDTFVRLVETLGADKALELLYCTEDLEQAGGLMTVDGRRRRTPGGVYLFLVKDDNSISRQQQNFIFYGSDDERRRQQKQMKQRRWKQHRDNIDAAKSYPPCDDLRPLPDCRDLFLSGKLPNGNSEPSSQNHSTDMCDADTIDDAAAAAADDDDDDDDDDVVNIELDLV